MRVPGTKAAAATASAGNISSVAHDLPGQLARFAAETLAAGAASAPAAGAATGAGGSAQGTYPFVDRRRK